MKKTTLIKLGMLPMALATTALQAQVINFHDASQGTIPGYNQLYFGQGAYSDPGNNVWNGFSSATYAGGGPGSTLFYGPGNPYPASGGNPGNPYAAYGTSGTVTGSGSVLFGSPGTTPNGPGTTPAGNATSAGSLSPVTLSMNFGSDNGATAGSVLGQPSWLLTSAALVNGTHAPGVFTLNNVAAGTYNLYLYGQNYDATRGAAFSITTGGGTAVGGFTSTINTGNKTSFVLGDNYVEFTGLSPVGGVISGTWAAVSNPFSGLSGEGNFNGLQLVTVVPEPSTIALLGLGIGGMFALRRRK
ncbi:MAG: hypothetical protein JWR26_2943 [Pedosphaera sp.]|nr:hypothetical protein [Pedosphaera sp.]